MRFVQVNDPAALQSISLAVSRAVHLQELSVQADSESKLGSGSLLASCNGTCSVPASFSGPTRLFRWLLIPGFDEIDDARAEHI